MRIFYIFTAWRFQRMFSLRRFAGRWPRRATRRRNSARVSGVRAARWWRRSAWRWHAPSSSCSTSLRRNCGTSGRANCVHCRLAAGSSTAEQITALKKAGVKLYFLACGTSDFLWENSVTLDKTMTDCGLEHTFYKSDGGHVWANWRLYLNTFAQLLFK